MAQLKYALDLNLKAYPNELTPDVDNDYTVKVHTQSTPLTQEDIAASVADRLGDDPSVGITLTSVSDPDTSFFIPPVKVSPNTPKKLQFSLPAGVTEGEWTVQVTTQYSSGSTLTKEPRTFTLPHPIVVGEVTEPGGSDDDDSGQGTFG